MSSVPPATRRLALAAVPLLAIAAPALAADPPAADHGVVQGLTVTAERPKAQSQLDRQVYVVTGNLQATGGSAADVLNETPSVDVTADGAVTLRGDANVTILIDGKPQAAFTGAAAGTSLQQLPASDIDRIEVMTNPPAQYRAEGSGGVINIVTKKTRRPGLTGSARAGAGPDGRFVLSGDGAYATGRWKLTGGLGLRRDRRDRLTTDARTEADPQSGALTQSSERIDEHFNRLTPSARMGFEAQAGKAWSLGGSASVTDMTGHRWFDQTDQGGPPGGAITSAGLRHSDGHERHVEGAEEAHLAWAPTPDGQRLDLSLQHSTVSEHERYRYANTHDLPPGPQTFDDLFLGLELAKTRFAADYRRPLAGGAELRLGYALEADDDAFDNRGDSLDPVTGAPTPDPTVSNSFRYRQTVHAVYAQWARETGGWSLQAGARAEWTLARWRLITGDIPGRRRDFGVYPSLQAQRKLGETGKLTFAVSRRITRPDPEALNPFSDHQDIYNLRAGNPDLRPQDTWSAQAGISRQGSGFSGGLTAYARLDRDAVTDVAQPLGGGVVLLTKANLPTTRSGGLEFSLSGKLVRTLSYSVSGQAFVSQIDARLLGAAGLRSTRGVNLKASLDWKPTATDTWQVSFSRADRRLTPQGYVDAIDLVNLGVEHKLRPNLSLIATVSDALNGQVYSRVLTAPGLTDRYQRRQAGRIALVSLVWRYGGKAPAKTDFDYTP